MVRSAGNLVKSFIVMITAFFELCLMGRAVYAWRIAYSNSNNPLYRRRACGTCPPNPPLHALNFLNIRRSLIAIAVTVVLVVFFSALGILAAIENVSVSPHQVVKEDVTVLESETSTRKATEGTSSSIGRAGQIAIECCVIASIIMIVGGILINSKRKESLYGQEKGNYKTHQRNPFITL